MDKKIAIQLAEHIDNYWRTYLSDISDLDKNNIIRRLLELLFIHGNEELNKILYDNIQNNTLFLSPDGTPTTLNPVQWLYTQTESFKNSGPYLLNEHKEPVIFYHGTLHHTFDTFKNEGDGIYFTPSRTIASSYGGNDAHPYQAFIQSDNLYMVDFNGDSDIEEGESHSTLVEEYHHAVANGYDVVSALNTFDGEHQLDQLVIDRPEQIHLADTRSLLAKVGLRSLSEEEESGVICRTAEDCSIIKKNMSAGTLFKAPNGLPSQLTPRQWIDVRTNAFKQWFGDWEHDEDNASKCVDRNGEPKVYYHGTNHGGFTVFQNELENPFRHSHAPVESLWFTDNREVAESYTLSKASVDQRAIESPKGQENKVEGIYECFLNIRQPLERDFEGAHFDGFLYRKYEIYLLDESGHYEETYIAPDGTRYFDSKEEAIKMMEQEGYVNYELRDEPFIGYDVNELVQETLDHIPAYDGTVAYNLSDYGPHGDAETLCNDFIVYSPSQIKSATLNLGIYDFQSDDIRFQRSDSDLHQHTEDETRLRDHLIWLMREAGIKVCTDHAEGQALIDALHQISSDGTTDTLRTQRVFHGSSADFQKFDFSHFGTGEGHHIFGWGGYFTESQSLATHYAYVPALGRIQKQRQHYDALQATIKSYQDELEHLKKEIKTPEEQKNYDFKNLTLDWFQRVSDKIGRQLNEDNHFLYIVEIPDNNGTNYLDFSSKPDSHLIDRAKEELVRWLINNDVSYRDTNARTYLRQELEILDDSSTCRELYDNVQSYIGDEQLTSELFKQMGYVGIVYPINDATSTEKGANYVIFKETDINLKEQVRCFRDQSGTIYGFAYGNEVYVDTDIASSETPIHEYAHLWAAVMQKNNPGEWKHIVSLLRDTLLWDEIKERYPELKDEDAIADEVLATYSGHRGAEQLRKAVESEWDTEKADQHLIEKTISHLKEAFDIFWSFVGDFLSIHYYTKEQVADQILMDLLHGVNPVERSASPLEQSTFRAHVADPAEEARLEGEETIKVYRAAQKRNGYYYPSMSALVLDNGQWKWRSPIVMGQWEVSDENPSLANEEDKFVLNKGNQSTISARYNPYFHTSRTLINDQFSSAWNRPELCVLEVEIPRSELTSGYKAEKAKDSVGEMEWKSGPIGRQLAQMGNPRRVILSRFDRPLREVPVEEVALHYAKALEGTKITVPFNTVNAPLREALVKLGVVISSPERNNAGRASLPAYRRWRLDQTLKSHLQLLSYHLNLDITTNNDIDCKGRFDALTGEIQVNLSNHDSVEDLQRTVFHEAVGHYGLRAIFGEGFNQFIENVYYHVEPTLRSSIDRLAQEKGISWRVATEEYLSNLSEESIFNQAQQRGWFDRIRHFFKQMVALTFPDYPMSISKAQLMDILSLSYHRLKQGITTYPTVDPLAMDAHAVRYYHRDNEMVNINQVDWYGTIKVYAVSDYRPVAHLCQEVKQGNHEAIQMAASRMSRMLKRIAEPEKQVLVPIPNRSGKAEYTLALATQLSQLTGIPVINALQGSSRDSLYQTKSTSGKDNLHPIPYELIAPIPLDKQVMLVDNVIDTGNNAMGALRALGRDCEIVTLGATNLFARYNYPIILSYLPVRKRNDLQFAIESYVEKNGFEEPQYSRFVRLLINNEEKQIAEAIIKDARTITGASFDADQSSLSEVSPMEFDEKIKNLISQFNIESIQKISGKVLDTPSRIKETYPARLLSGQLISAYAYKFVEQGGRMELMISPHLSDLVQDKNSYSVREFDKESAQMLICKIAQSSDVPLHKLLFMDNYQLNNPFLSEIVEQTSTGYNIKTFNNLKNNIDMNETKEELNKKNQENETRSTQNDGTSAPEKKHDSWKTHDYSQYKIPEGIKIENLNVFSTDTAEGKRYYVSCKMNGSRRSERLSYPDVCAFFEKNEQGQLTKRVSAEQLFAKYVFNPENQKENKAMEQDEADKEATSQILPDEYGNIQSALLASAFKQSVENNTPWLNDTHKAYPSLRGLNMMVSPFNALIMALRSDLNHYATNVYTTFSNSKNEGIAVRSKQTSIPFNWFRWDKYQHKYGSGEPISKETYEALPADEKSLYRALKNKQEVRLFNIDQTLMKQQKKELYESIIQESGAIQVSPDECFEKRWKEIKSKHPEDVAAIFRTHDGYSAFGNDAEVISKMFALELSEKEPCLKEDTPLKMVSFPYSDLDTYLPKMVHNNIRVAIYDGCENLISGYVSKPEVKDQLDSLTKGLMAMGAMKTNIGETHCEDGKLYITEKKTIDDRKSLDALTRAALDYIMDDSRLAVQTPVQGTAQDNIEYKELVKELSVGALALESRMFATLSPKSKELVESWNRELRENHELIEHLERDVNATVGIMNLISQGKIDEIDYQKTRGEKRAGLLAGHNYSIVESLNEQASLQRKLMVVIRSQDGKSADVVMPEGSSLSMDKEIQGMAKNRILIALKKEGVEPEHIHFYNAGGVNGMKEPNEYYADKKIEVCRLKQYTLIPVSTIDVSKELQQGQQNISRILVLQNEEKQQHFYITLNTTPKQSFAIRPEGKDIKRFYESRKGADADKVLQELGNKYYTLVKSHPDLKVDLFGVKANDAKALERIGQVVAYKGKDEKFYLRATIDGEKQQSKEISKTQYRCLFITDDAASYKKALAVRVYGELLNNEQAASKEAKQEVGQESVSSGQNMPHTKR